MLPARRMFDVAWPDTVPSPMPDPGSLELRAQHEPPSHIRLGPDTVSRSAARGYSLEPGGPDTLGLARVGSRAWSVRGDTIVLVWSTGWAGARLTLMETPYGLEGVAVAFTDVITSSLPAARVTLLRAPCREPPSTR
jgi:hypothetical protein